MYALDVYLAQNVVAIQEIANISDARNMGVEMHCREEASPCLACWVAVQCRWQLSLWWALLVLRSWLQSGLLQRQGLPDEKVCYLCLYFSRWHDLYVQVLLLLFHAQAMQRGCCGRLRL
eukprot:jgi/Ulvmu1/969/UM102_0053.1